MDLSTIGLSIGAEIYANHDLVAVYQATETRTGQLFAVKRIKLGRSLPFDYYLREVQTMQQIRHPNIVKLVGAYLYPSQDSPEYLLIIMPYFPQGDLSREIKRRSRSQTPWSEPELLEYLGQLVGALAHLESQRIAHRDIKPQNIFVHTDQADTMTLLVGDLGSGILGMEQQVQTRTLVGTPLYLSPALRQAYIYFAAGQGLMQTDHNVFKSDVYSLGLVFYEMVTLNKVHRFANLATLNETITDSLAQIQSSRLKELLSQMLTIEEARRPTFGNLLEQVKSLLQDKERTLSPPESQRSSLPRRQVAEDPQQASQLRELVSAVNAEGFMFFSRENAVQYLAHNARMLTNVHFQVCIEQEEFIATLEGIRTELNGRDQDIALKSSLTLLDCLGYKLTATIGGQEHFEVPAAPLSQYDFVSVLTG